jgi:hypothetical protein
MDGVANAVFDVLDVAPFEVSDPTTPFAAPSDTISDQTGILATDVTAPVTVLPDTTQVTQPTDTTTPPSTDEGVTPPVVTEDSNTLGITPGFGNIEATPLGTMGDTGIPAVTRKSYRSLTRIYQYPNCHRSSNTNRPKQF